MIPNVLYYILMFTCPLLIFQRETAAFKKRDIFTELREVPSIENYPFVVALVYYFTETSMLRQCTGSAIRSHMILTSSHCTQTNVAYAQYTNFDKRPEDDFTKKKVVENIVPSKRGTVKLQKDQDAAITVALLRIRPFANDEITYGVLSKVTRLHLGDIHIYAGLKEMNLPFDYSGKSYSTASLFTSEGVVVTCPFQVIYSCIRISPEYVAARSGGPVLVDGEIVGVINRPFAFGGKNYKNVLTVIPVQQNRQFINSECTRNKPEDE